MSTSNSVQVDGGKLKTLRTEKGLSREQLAEKAGMSSKSIQRAENNEKLRPEYINQIANVLGCDQAVLIADTDDVGQIQLDLPPHHEAIRLKRPESAKDLFKALKSDILDFEFDIDFDETLSEAIAEIIRPFEELRDAKNKGSQKTSDEVVGIGKLSSSLKALEKKGVCIFIGFTTYRSKHYMRDLSNQFIRTATVPERSKTLIVFSNCQGRTRLEQVDIGLTYAEAKDWLLEELENTKRSETLFVHGRDFGIAENSLYEETEKQPEEEN